MSGNYRYSKRNKRKRNKRTNYLPVVVPVFIIAIVAVVYIFVYQGGDNVQSSGDVSTGDIVATTTPEPDNGEPDTDLEGDLDGGEEHLGDPVVDIPEDTDDPQTPETLSYPLGVEVTEVFDVYVVPNINSRVVETTQVGDMITVSSLTRNDMVGVNTPDMLKITTANGTIGFIEPSFIEQTTLDKLCELDGFISCTATSEENAFNVFDEKYQNLSIDEKFGLLKQWYPHNRNWNTIGLDTEGMDQDYAVSLITDTACNHSSTSQCQCYNGLTLNEFSFSSNIQCLAFASMVSDFLFGKTTPINIFYDIDKIQVGDHIRYINSTHSMIVTEVTGDGFRLVEVNADYQTCRIQWDRYLSKEELSLYNFEVLSRY